MAVSHALTLVGVWVKILVILNKKWRPSLLKEFLFSLLSAKKISSINQKWGCAGKNTKQSVPKTYFSCTLCCSEGKDEKPHNCDVSLPSPAFRWIRWIRCLVEPGECFPSLSSPAACLAASAYLPASVSPTTGFSLETQIWFLFHWEICVQVVRPACESLRWEIYLSNGIVLHVSTTVFLVFIEIVAPCQPAWIKQIVGYNFCQ